MCENRARFNVTGFCAKHQAVADVEMIVPSIGTSRRIRALRAIGWTVREISERAGITEEWVYALCIEEYKTMQLKTYISVKNAYDEMWTGAPKEPHYRVIMKMWPIPMDWDDDSIDDEKSEPRTTKKNLQHRRDKLLARREERKRESLRSAGKRWRSKRAVVRSEGEA